MVTWTFVILTDATAKPCVIMNGVQLFVSISVVCCHKNCPIYLIHSCILYLMEREAVNFFLSSGMHLLFLFFRSWFLICECLRLLKITSTACWPMNLNSVHKVAFVLRSIVKYLVII